MVICALEKFLGGKRGRKVWGWYNVRFPCFSGVNLLYEKHLEEENGIGGVFWP